jgi:hypothetical protein
MNPKHPSSESKKLQENNILTAWQWRKSLTTRQQDLINRTLLHRLHEARA